MSLSAHHLERLVRLGCDTDIALLAARFVEWRKDGIEILEALLGGFEQRPAGDSFSELFPRFVAALGGIPEEREAANDRVPRMSSGRRRSVYTQLADRDEESCCHCGVEPKTIWRRLGVWALGEARYTKVHPTSNLEVDHRIPLWQGGDNDLSNLWLLCIDCHKQKTAREASERRRA